MPRPVLLCLVWLLGAVLSIGTGLLAVRLVADRVGDEPQPSLSLEQIQAATRSVAPTSSAGTPTGAATDPSRPGSGPGGAGGTGTGQAPGSGTTGGSASGPTGSGTGGSTGSVGTAPTTRPTERPTTTARPTAGPRPTTTRAPTGSSTAPTTSAPRTFSLTGGVVSVRCAGSRGQLVYATPAQGWSLDERSVSGTEVEVRFRRDDTRSRIRLSCSGGTPVEVDRRVDTSGGGGGDD